MHHWPNVFKSLVLPKINSWLQAAKRTDGCHLARDGSCAFCVNHLAKVLAYVDRLGV